MRFCEWGSEYYDYPATTIQSHVASGRVFGRCLHTQEYLPEVIGRIIVLNRR